MERKNLPESPLLRLRTRKAVRAFHQLWQKLFRLDKFLGQGGVGKKEREGDAKIVSYTDVRDRVKKAKR